MPTSPRLYDNLPLYAKMVDEDGVLEHVAESLQTHLDAQRRRVEERPYTFDPKLAPANFLPFLGQFAGLANDGNRWLGIGLNVDWPVEHQRKVIERAPKYWASKGTDLGIREAIALWLMWEPAHDEGRLLLTLPFGETPTSMPPQWGDYYTPYEFDLNQTWVEKQRYGPGDHASYSPVLYQQLDSQWTGEWNEPWSDRCFDIALPKFAETQGSGLAPQRPWMHFFVHEYEWNLIAPYINELNPAIWNTHANPVVFLWLSLMSAAPVVLEEPPDAAQFTVEIQCVEEGFEFGDWWPYPSESPPTSGPASIEQSGAIDGTFPGHGFGDHWNSVHYATDGTAWYWSPEVEPTGAEAGAGPVVPEEGLACTPGIEVEVEISRETLVIPAVEYDPNQFMERVEGWSIALIDHGVELPDTVEIEPLDHGITHNLEIWSFALTSDDLCRFEEPVNIHLYGYSWSEGWQYYSPGGLLEPERTIEQSTTNLVQLCNIRDVYSQQRILEQREIRTPIPAQEVTLFGLYPMLQRASDLRNWSMVLETCHELITLAPATAFWTNKNGPGELADRAQSPSLDEGRLNLYLEYVFELPHDTELLSFGLYLDGTLIRGRDFASALTLNQWNAGGIRFVVPFKLENGAGSAAESSLFEDYLIPIWRSFRTTAPGSNPLEQLPSSVESVAQSFLPERLNFTTNYEEWVWKNQYAQIATGAGAQATSPLQELPELGLSIPAILPTRIEAPEPQNIQDALRAIQDEFEALADRVEAPTPGSLEAERIHRRVLLGGERLSDPGTRFRVDTRLGHNGIAVIQVRETTAPFEEIARPRVALIGQGVIELTFWGDEIADGALEVWYASNPA